MHDTKNRRRWRWRALLRRPLQPAAVLLVLGVLVIGEPLMCVLHCHVWMPAAISAPAAAAHAHHHHGHAAAAAQPAVEGIPAPASALRCAAPQPGSDVPAPPSPIHDLVLPVAMLLGVLTVRARRPAAAQAAPWSLRHPPPTPPPIAAP